MILLDGVNFKALHIDMQELVESLERICGFELTITSAYRLGDKKCHGRGRAVDIRCSHSVERMTIVRGLIFLGVSRIGIYDKHVHADTCRIPFPSNVMWTGISR